MAKEKEITIIKGKKAEFNLVGKAKVSGFTFKTDLESDKSDWIYNQMNLGVECGKEGTIYADLMGGYGSERENVVFVHGKKKGDNGQDQDDFDNMFQIDWEDRLDEDNFESIGDRCFITVGLEKDDKDKTIYKKFLSAYDAIQYIGENLEDGTVINVKGDLVYKKYKDNYTVTKEIKSIALSNATEDKFKATFTQTIFVESDAIGKPDKETMTIPVTGYVMGFFKELNGDKITRKVKGKEKDGCNLPIVRTFDVEIAEEKENTMKFLKQFKAKSKKVTEITVEGIFTKGSVNTVEVGEEDIPDDIKELIELGVIDKDEVVGKMTFANGGGRKPERMIIKKPFISMVESNGNKVPKIDRTADKYGEDDLNPYLIIEAWGGRVIKSDDITESNDEENTEDEDIEVDVNKLMDEESEGDTEEEEDWLAGL